MDKQWTTFASYPVLSIDWHTLVMSAALALLVCVMYIYHTEWYVERSVTRRRKKKQWREKFDHVQQKLTETLENEVRVGKFKRPEVDRFYAMLRKAGFHEVGPEPSFGKPWYSCPSIAEPASKVKKVIKGRLKQMGVDYRTALTTIKQKRSAKSNADIVKELRASLKKV